MKDDAENLFEDKIKQGSTDKEDYFALGSLYLSSGKYDKFFNLYQEIEKLPLSKEDIGQVFFEKAEALQAIGNKAEAIKFYNKSLETLHDNENTADILFYKGSNNYNLFTLGKKENGEESIRNFEEILNEYPNFELKYKIFSYLGEINKELDKYPKAERYYQLAIDHSDSEEDLIWAMVGLANVYTFSENYKKAEKTFKEILKKASNKIYLSKIYYDMGKLFFCSGAFVKAKDAFGKASQRQKDDPSLKNNKEYEIDIIWHLGTIAYEQDDFDESLRYLEEVLKRIDCNHMLYASANITLGHLFLHFKNYHKVREHYSNVFLAPYITPEERNRVEDWLKKIPLDS